MNVLKKSLSKKKKYTIKPKFTSKNPFEISILQIKSYGHKSERLYENVKKESISTSFLFLSITCDLKVEISYRFLEVESSLTF